LGFSSGSSSRRSSAGSTAGATSLSFRFGLFFLLLFRAGTLFSTTLLALLSVVVVVVELALVALYSSMDGGGFTNPRSQRFTCKNFGPRNSSTIPGTDAKDEEFPTGLMNPAGVPFDEEILPFFTVEFEFAALAFVLLLSLSAGAPFSSLFSITTDRKY
ncbi:hypothetical protein Ocin01_03088, partial [Orchesella cincta]